MYQRLVLLSLFWTRASLGTAYEIIKEADLVPPDSVEDLMRSIETLEDENYKRAGFFDRFRGTVEEPALRSAGQRCSDDNGQQCESDDLSCSDGLLGTGKRCVPKANSCFVETAKNFSQTFNHAEWTELVLANAGLIMSDLIAASDKAGNFEAFQKTPEFQALVSSFNANMPTSALKLLQMSADECRVNAGLDPKQQCSIPYVGFHLELGIILEVKLSILCFDYNNVPYRVLRGTTGFGPQAGFEMSFEFGWFFTDNPDRIEGDGISFDADVAVGAGVGMALHIGIGGNDCIQAANALEFTIGGGIGGGLGIATSMTSVWNCTSEPTSEPRTSAPTSSRIPTRVPTPRPTSTPTAKPTFNPA